MNAVPVKTDIWSYELRLPYSRCVALNPSVQRHCPVRSWPIRAFVKGQPFCFNMGNSCTEAKPPGLEGKVQGVLRHCNEVGFTWSDTSRLLLLTTIYSGRLSYRGPIRGHACLIYNHL